MQVGIKIGIGDRTHHSGSETQVLHNVDLFGVGILLQAHLSPKKKYNSNGEGKVAHRRLREAGSRYMEEGWWERNRKKTPNIP